MRRTIISLLLAAAVILSLTLAPDAYSQSYTIITNYQTTTFPTTLTTVTVVTAQSINTQTITSTNTATGLTTLYPSDTDTVKGRNPNDCGYYSYFDFTVTKGQAIKGKLSADNPIGFYVMSQSDLKTWEKSVGCDVFAPTR